MLLSRPNRLVCVFAALTFVVALQAQNSTEAWQSATDLPGVDLSALSAPQKQAALKMMRERGCPCGCAMKVAECREKDPACSFSRGISVMVVNGVKAGKTPEQIEADIANSPLGRDRGQPPPLLEQPVPVPIEGSPVRGPANAKVTLVEFSDFECPYCARAVPEIDALLKAFPSDVRLVFKQFPLEMHPHAQMAAAAALAARDQGKFWEMHDLLFANAHSLTADHINALAQQLGLDMRKFTLDVASEKTKHEIERDLTDGDKAGVNGTPAFYINGKHYNGPPSLEVMKPILDAELGKSPIQLPVATSGK